MKQVTLGSTGIVTPQNGFGALPIQRIDFDAAAALLHGAFEGGMTFFDTARAYSDSEEKIGYAFGAWDHPRRDQIFLATKTMATTPDAFWQDLETSLANMKTSYIDIYQLHNVSQVYKPGDGTGMYECLIEAKEKGLIRHIGITMHQIATAEEALQSGLYETIQYPISYLAIDREIKLVTDCAKANVGFIGMKGLSGGLLTNARACMAFAAQFDAFVPIWGIQHQHELDEWLSFMQDTPQLDAQLQSVIAKDRKELKGNFCRSCGYCMPCPVGIPIFQAARISQLMRRMPPDYWLSEAWQEQMKKIEDCTHCGQCAAKCPYGLDTPKLLELNYADYQQVLSGKISVR